MKRILIIILGGCLLVSCQKSEKLPANPQPGATTNGLNPQPANAYRWTAMHVPAIPYPPYNYQNYENLVIPVGEDVYFLTGSLFDKKYKLNNSTKEWEPYTTSNNGYMGFGVFSAGYQYLFSYAGKIYHGLMQHGPEFNGNFFGSMDPATGITEDKARFPGITTDRPVCFVLGNKGYLIARSSAQTPGYVWEYNFTTDQWTNIGLNPLGNREGAVAMVTNGKVYLGLGYITQYLNGIPVKVYKKDWIEYTPGSSLNISKAGFPGAARSYAKGFVLNGSIFLGLGEAGTTFYTDFWKYDPATNNWTQQAGVPGYTPEVSNNSGSFVSGSAGYVVKGQFTEFWRFSFSSITGN